MKKVLSLSLFLLSAACIVLAFRYRPASSSLTVASSEDPGNTANMNQPLPRAVMPGVDGEWANLEDYKGKVMLISFWTTWCPGCRHEVPELIKLQNEFASQGFQIVAIAVDDDGEESVKDFVQSERFNVDGASLAINFPILLGQDELARRLGFEGELPASVLVTRDSKEVRIIRGQVRAKEVSRFIKPLL
jgi:thiol-disulfide isomerase/thioredoxin